VTATYVSGYKTPYQKSDVSLNETVTTPGKEKRLIQQEEYNGYALVGCFRQN
jgi:hypothetical protein